MGLKRATRALTTQVSQHSVLAGSLSGFVAALIVMFWLGARLQWILPSEPKVEYSLKRVVDFDYHRVNQPSITVYDVEFFNKGAAENGFSATLDYGEGEVVAVHSWPEGLSHSPVRFPSITFKAEPFKKGDHFTAQLLYTGTYNYEPIVTIMGDGPRPTAVDLEAVKRKRITFIFGALTGVILCLLMNAFWATRKIRALQDTRSDTAISL